MLIFETLMKWKSCIKIVFIGTLSLVASFAFAQVPIYEKYQDLDRAIFQKFSPDTTYVVNYWATWCGPCVKELPYFEELHKKYNGQAFKQILVSLDSPKKVESKVVPFMNKNKIESEVVLLADGKYNNWIDLVDPSWSGAIPITLIIKGDQKLFYEQEFHSMKELEIELLKLF